ncbi:MAG: phosphoribosylformylglycinamidine synthase subunit PurQ [Ignavibacteria bacterium]|nr:phosphoribosylformylglycinamidine synthase subunit PurQ [Ignavibacteria bacterium]
MKFGVVIFPGSNCDYDSFHVLKRILKAETVFLFHKEDSLQNCDAIVLPGGFSYGDYLRTGSIARFTPIMQEVIAFAINGGIVIGICNGFQILCESNLLPGVLIKNENLRFKCFDTFLRVENNKTSFTKNFHSNEVVKFPIAHGDGCYFTEEETLVSLEKNEQILLKYCDRHGNITPDSNPNGSVANIAGICNEKKNVFGLMPHPERCSESILGSTDGIKIFESIFNNN